MLLIDALYINTSGGLELLRYLVNVLEQRNVNCFYLFDKRCSAEFKNVMEYKKSILTANTKNRYRFYKENYNRFTKILCFANIPPLIKSSVVVYTYFHNINLLITPKELPLKTKILTKLKKLYILLFRNNTTYWIVQTENTKSALKKAIQKDNIIILPFFDLTSVQKNETKFRTDYIYVSNYAKPKNHINLLRAWNILYDKGYKFTLHLTLQENTFPNKLKVVLEECQKNGAVINHGFVNKEKINELYNKSKATIYPSFNESLGLGIVEAMHAGCDVIAADLPYIHSICIPSRVFDPLDVDSIVSSVEKYETGSSKKTIQTIDNKINELVELII